MKLKKRSPPPTPTAAPTMTVGQPFFVVGLVGEERQERRNIVQKKRRKRVLKSKFTEKCEPLDFKIHSSSINNSEW
jgi:hypothetical protein